MNGDESRAGLSIPALLFKKFIANRIPRQLSFQPTCKALSRKPPTVRKRDGPVVKAIRFFR
jgi:hypothetical protein